MTSNRNIFRITGLLCGEFTGHRRIPLTKASDAELWCFDLCQDKQLSKQSWGWWFQTPSRSLWRHCNDAICREKLQTLLWRRNGSDSISKLQPHDCLLSRLFGGRSKKTSKLRATGLCAGNSQGTGEFPAQMASYAENVSIWWRHHDFKTTIAVSLGWNFFVPSLFVRYISNFANIPVKYWESHSYLTGVTAAELRGHLPDMNMLFKRSAAFC